MKAPIAKFSLAATAIVLAVAAHGAAHADCETLIAAFDRAVAAHSIDGAQRAATGIADDILCGSRGDEFQERLVEFLIAHAGAAATPAADRQRAIAMARESLEVTGTWRNAERLANYFMDRGDRGMALYWYEKSVSLQNAPGVKSAPAERQSLLANAAAAKILANDDRQGERTIVFAGSTRDPSNGKLGGIYAPGLLRGAKVVAVPLPINFYTDEPRFTPAGEQALKEFAAAAREQQVRTMKLVGHADPRGAAQYNMDLSRRRVEAVRNALVAGGVTARIMIDWKGSEQPIDIGTLHFKPSQEELWALDRRVEWVREGTAQ